ncbi:MAG TPA: recombinase family protein [Polyangiaceae bacterium]|jgi:DNA invertase Pin-like site-specific DNA recombinase
MSRKVAAPPRACKRVAIYTRKSTSAGLEQEYNSLDAQRDACEAYAKSQGWTVVGSYDDGGFSGANVERPAFQRLLADVDAGKVDVVVVYKVDRLSRSLLDFARVMDRFAASGAAFVSVTQNFSTADAIGRLTLNMLMSFAEFEREMIAERTRDKIAAARRKGKWTGGAVPIGYYAVEGKLVKNAPEATLVCEVFELYERHQSVLDVVHEMGARGRKRKGGIWTKDAVLRVLKNPLYAGLIRAGSEVYEADHEALVERARFDRVQQLLARPPRAAGSAGRNPAYLLSGLLRCRACGAAMTSGGTRGYRYYRCTTRDKLGVRACPCKPMSAEAIEEFVVERLRTLAADDGHVTELAERLRVRFETDARALADERAPLPARIAKLSAEADALLASLTKLAGKARSLAEQRLQTLGAAVEESQTQLGVVEHKLAALAGARADAQWVREALSDFDTLWELMTPVNRQRLVTALVERIEVHEAAGEIDLKIASLAEAA